MRDSFDGGRERRLHSTAPWTLPAAPPFTDNPSEIVGEALTFAALNDRREVVDYLVDVGVAIDSAPYRGSTPLHFAVQFAKATMVEHVVARGASLRALDHEWQAAPSRWAEVGVDGPPERQNDHRNARICRVRGLSTQNGL